MLLKKVFTDNTAVNAQGESFRSGSGCLWVSLHLAAKPQEPRIHTNTFFLHPVFHRV